MLQYKFTPIVLFLLLILLCIQCSAEVEEVDILPFALKSEALYIESTLDIPRRSEGDILLTDNGDILLVYTKFVGGYQDHDKALLVKQTSTDKGKNWSDEETIVSGEGNINVMSASLLQLQNGTIALFYLVKNSISDCYPVVRFSKDGGATWSSPTACLERSGYYTVNNSRAIQLSTGRIVIPLSYYVKTGNQFDGYGKLFCCYSDDNGVTWKQGGYVPDPSIKMQEPGVVELEDGRMLMFIRTDQECQYFAYSRNGGISWDKPIKSSLKSPLSPCSIVRNPYTRELVVVWNNSTSERMPLCMAISEDEGNTWNKKVILEKKDNFSACYPAIEFLSSNDIFVLYSISPKEQWGLGSLKLISVKKH